MPRGSKFFEKGHLFSGTFCLCRHNVPDFEVRSYLIFNFTESNLVSFLQQSAVEMVRNFEDFFDLVLWRTIANPQSGEFEGFFSL